MTIDLEFISLIGWSDLQIFPIVFKLSEFTVPMHIALSLVLSTVIQMVGGAPAGESPHIQKPKERPLILTQAIVRVTRPGISYSV